MDLTEIMRAVYEAYPKIEKERTCWQEKMRREELRRLLKERLINENNKNEEANKLQEG